MTMATERLSASAKVPRRTKQVGVVPQAPQGVIISDACIGLAESAAELFPEGAWRRCIVHWHRNVFSHVPSTKVRETAAMLKAIHTSAVIPPKSNRTKMIRYNKRLTVSATVSSG